MKKICLFFIGLLCYACLAAQTAEVSPRWLHGFWTARWIAHPTAGASDFGVYHFRKNLKLDQKPARFIVHVSADNLYRLFVNGRSVSTGPARSDPANWNFESIDIAPLLVKGDNLLAATVWNFADHRAYAQPSFQTAFILQGDGTAESAANTGMEWKVIRDSAYQPLEIDRRKLQAYLAVASGETVDARHYTWDFMQPGSTDQGWLQVAVLWYPAKAKSFGTDGNWHLVPRSIPAMEEISQSFTEERTGNLRRLTGGRPFAQSFPLVVPAHTRLRLLLDQGSLTNAYPRIVFTGGRETRVQCTYAEALMDEKRVKGNRNDTEGKQIMGIRDRYIADGGRSRYWSPLHYRTFRYMELDIQTEGEALTIDSIGSIFTAYPFREKASFSADDPGLRRIWETGWRTARLCAMDTYMDCPYYEQLQYVGDTRIQALISLYVSGDDRLMRKAIDDISHSFIPEGLTQSRYPSRDLQVIPTFSLWWVCMLHDYDMHREDQAFISSHLNGVENVLRWYAGRLDSAGMLGPLSWWQFVDWSWPWVDSIRVGGVPPGASRGGSSIITLQFAYTLRMAADLMQRYGRPVMAANYSRLAELLCKETYRRCFDTGKGLMADTPDKNAYSQHANILAILADAVPVSGQADMLDKVMADQSLTQATYYFKFYLFEAMRKTGTGNRFLAQLKPWYDMLDIGLTTFAENPEPTRSDCHAWSASPVYELLSLTAGIEPAAPGFREVRIRPNPGHLRALRAAVPLPAGQVTLQWRKEDRGSSALVDMPEGVTGKFEWQGKVWLLKPGKNTLVLE
jgi:alpha-L-rhamnosidase